MRGIEDLLGEFTLATEEGRLVWKHVPSQFNLAIKGPSLKVEECFTAELPNHRIIVKEFPHDDVRGVRVILQDKSGKTLDGSDANEFSPRYPTMYRLFEIARRSAHDIPSVIDEVQSELAGLNARAR